MSGGIPVEENLIILSFNVADDFWADRLVSLNILVRRVECLGPSGPYCETLG